MTWWALAVRLGTLAVVTVVCAVLAATGGETTGGEALMMAGVGAMAVVVQLTVAIVEGGRS